MPKKGYKQTDEHKMACHKAIIALGKGYKHTNAHKIAIHKAIVARYASGWVMPLDARKKISLAHIKSGLRPPRLVGSDHPMWGVGFWCKCLNCGEDFRVPPNRSDSVKFCARKCMYKYLSGEGSPNWKGGITKLHRLVRNCQKYRQWHSDVLTKDGFMCQICGDETGLNLDVDHYPLPFNKIMQMYEITSKELAMSCAKLWDINNGRVLCRSCHLKTPTWGRYPKGERE